MTTLTIVATFNIFKDALPGLSSTREGSPFDAFFLESAEEALHRSVVVAIACPRHTHDNAVFA